MSNNNYFKVALQVPAAHFLVRIEQLNSLI